MTEWAVVSCGPPPPSRSAGAFAHFSVPVTVLQMLGWVQWAVFVSQHRLFGQDTRSSALTVNIAVAAVDLCWVIEAGLRGNVAYRTWSQEHKD
jgi:hypothetical protein